MIPVGALRNDAGQIAVKWTLPRQAKTIEIKNTKKYYVPTYAHNVAMYWVDEQDLAPILAHQEKRCNCANGIYQQAYVLANEIDVNLHKCGNRHCD